MADEAHDDSSGTPQQQSAGEVAKTFTQDDLDRIVADRVRKEKSKTDAYISDAVAQALAKEREAQRIASLDGEEKLKALYEAQLQAKATEAQTVTDELATVKRELATTKAEAQLASLGLPTDFAVNLLGKDDAETSKNIQAFNARVNELVTQKVNESVSRGTPKAGTLPTDGDELLKSMRAAAGL